MVDYQNLQSDANLETQPASSESFADRLAEIQEDVEQLRGDASYLADQVADLLSNLEDLIEDRQAGGGVGAALDAALDAVSWVHSALENVDGEFSSLSGHLDDAAEAINN
jgi:predicted transcriptional regulator